MGKPNAAVMHTVEYADERGLRTVRIQCESVILVIVFPANHRRFDSSRSVAISVAAAPTAQGLLLVSLLELGFPTMISLAFLMYHDLFS